MIETGFVNQEEDKSLVCDHRVKYILGGMNNSVMHCTVSLNNRSDCMSDKGRQRANLYPIKVFRTQLQSNTKKHMFRAF